MILGGVLKFIPDETIFCYDNKVVLVAWGMRYDASKHKDVGRLMHAIPQKGPSTAKFQIRFVAGTLGSIEGNTLFNIPEGEVFPEGSIPVVTPVSGYRFVGWDTNPAGFTVFWDLTVPANPLP